MTSERQFSLLSEGDNQHNRQEGGYASEPDGRHALTLRCRPTKRTWSEGVRNMCTIANEGWASTAVACVSALALLAISLMPARTGAQTVSTSSTTFTKSESTGTVSVVPGTAMPVDCVRLAKEICTFEVRGSEKSIAYEGPGELTERVTVDFTKPVSSGAGVCFPQMGIGTIHTSRGDYTFYNQGETCRPPQSAGVAPGFGNTMLHAVITGGTGRFQHAIGTLAVTVVSHPPAVTLYHTSGAIIGMEAAP